jgi:uncharacterized membrane protein YfcA
VTPSWSLIALLTAVAFVAGVIDAVAGGGGLLTVPALLAAGLPPHVALATNKGQSVFGSGAALVAFRRRGALDGELARYTFPLGFLGALCGTHVVLWIAPEVLKPVVVVLLPLAALSLFVQRRSGDGEPPRARLWLASMLALTIGAYDGFFGPGTGTFLVVGFSVLLHAPLLRASAEAKVVNFASNLAALSLFASRGVVLWQIALPMAVAQLAGGFTGAHLAVHGGDRLVRAVVVLVVLAVVVKLALDLAS